MTVLCQVIFWTSIAAVAYNYFGYPIVLFILAVFTQAKADFLYLLRRKSRRCQLPREVPKVAVLVSVYNEEAVIRAKIKNLQELDYPADRLEILLGLDAPIDGTAELLSQLPSTQFHVVQFLVRRGKLAVLSDLARRTSAEILVITDANTMLDRNCIRNLARHFADQRVGVVSGEEVRVAAGGVDAAGESLYWRYECALKMLENRLNCVQGANGAALAVRCSLFPPKKRTIVEDFQISLEARAQGYRVVYDPEAIAVEEVASTSSAQFTRRVRIGCGDYQTLFHNLHCLNPLRGLPAFAFFSHRALRWLTPVLLLVAFVCSVVMITHPGFVKWVAAQCIFYAMAITGYQLKKRGPSPRLLAIPLQFCATNLALLFGFFRFLRGGQPLTWKSTFRRLQPEVILDETATDR
jgi:cellulose synthase/poly-beta-1,6-N-acetylglucosamine synthase-like glycosyltransferase